MREILFRGMRTQCDEWVEGNGLVCQREHSGRDFIPAFDKDRNIIHMFEVVPETVGQFTGLTDKNGKRIFEGDIVTIPGSKRQGLPATIEYFPQGAVFQIRRVGYNAITLWDANESVEVIGNIHDNPELLEGE